MRYLLILLLMIIPVKSFSTQAFPIEFGSLVSNIIAAYQVKIIDTAVIYKHEINRNCNIKYTSARIVRIRFIKWSDLLSDCNIDCAEKMQLDTLSTEFTENFPIYFQDCKLSYYSTSIPWSGEELGLEPGKRYNFFFSDPTEKSLYRAETPSFSNISILRHSKTFKFIETNNPEIYGSIKTFEFDEPDGVYILTNNNDLYYFSNIYKIVKTIDFDHRNIEGTNKIIYYYKSGLYFYKNGDLLMFVEDRYL